VRRERHTEGFTLVELLIVVALFGLVIAAMFTVLQALSRMTTDSVEQSTASRDLSYQMEILSKTIMQGNIVYANDDVVFLHTRAGTGYRMSKVYVDTVTTNGVTRGRLVVDRWSANALGTTATSAMTRWVVSDRNGNLLVPLADRQPLFRYYVDGLDTSLLLATARASTDTTALASFVGNLPGGYPLGNLRRLRLTVVTSQSSGTLFRDASRDVRVRQWK
jgi:prepilin-type N-terminal cleavage/methylation domain-containing protein